MKVAAYQAPLLPSGSMAAIGLIRTRIAWCEAEGIEILCCPEAILGGLADSATPPIEFALNVTGHLFNSAAVFHKGSSGIVAADGHVAQSAIRLAEDVLIADLPVTASFRLPP